MKTYTKPIASVAITNLSEAVADPGTYYSGRGINQLSKSANGSSSWEKDDEDQEW